MLRASECHSLDAVVAAVDFLNTSTGGGGVNTSADVSAPFVLFMLASATVVVDAVVGVVLVGAETSKEK